MDAKMYIRACIQSCRHKTRQDGDNDYTKYYPDNTEKTSKERFRSTITISGNMKTAVVRLQPR